MLMVHGWGMTGGWETVPKTMPSVIAIIFHYINATQVSAGTILIFKFK